MLNRYRKRATRFATCPKNRASDTVIQTNTYALLNSAGSIYGIYAQNVLVSPNSTAAVTYFTEMALTGGGGNVYTQTGGTTSNIILMEISA